MALVKGTNSFVTLNEANSYFDDRMDAAEWTSATDDVKEQALVTATNYLDELVYAGQVVSSEQMLAFPRTGVYTDSSRGTRSYLSSSYTFVSDTDETEASLNRDIRLLRRACFELSYHMISNEGVMDRSGSFQSIKVGSISLVGETTAETLPYSIRKIVKPMLLNSTRSWEGW
jgi:hypothetical protein